MSSALRCSSTVPKGSFPAPASVHRSQISALKHEDESVKNLDIGLFSVWVCWECCFFYLNPFQTERNCVATIRGGLKGKCNRCEWAVVFTERPSVSVCMCIQYVSMCVCVCVCVFISSLSSERNIGVVEGGWV